MNGQLGIQNEVLHLSLFHLCFFIMKLAREINMK